MDQIGFIGVGSMGSRMARRLHQAGYSLTVCDRDPAALREFENLGTAIADYAIGLRRQRHGHSDGGQR